MLNVHRINQVTVGIIYLKLYVYGSYKEMIFKYSIETLLDHLGR